MGVGSKVEAFNPKNASPTVSDGGGDFMFWGCFSAVDMRNLYQGHEVIKKKKCCADILKDNLMESGFRSTLGLPARQ